MTPKCRAQNLSVIFACLCFSKSLLIKTAKIHKTLFFIIWNIKFFIEFQTTLDYKFSISVKTFEGSYL